MNPIMTNQPEFELIGIVDTFSYVDPEQKAKLTVYWQNYLGQQIDQKIANPVEPHLTYALYHNYQPTGEYSLLLGKEVASGQEPLDGFERCQVPAGRYVIIEIEGDNIFDRVGQAWAFVWSPGFEYIRAFTHDYEVYHMDTFKDGSMKVELFIAIK